jgi:hypothetical protein
MSKLLFAGLLGVSLFASPTISQQAASCQEIIGLIDAVEAMNSEELRYVSGDRQNKRVDQAIDMVDFILEAMETTSACEVSIEKQLEKSQDALYALSI